MLISAKLAVCRISEVKEGWSQSEVHMGSTETSTAPQMAAPLQEIAHRRGGSLVHLIFLVLATFLLKIRSRFKNRSVNNPVGVGGTIPGLLAGSDDG